MSKTFLDELRQAVVRAGKAGVSRYRICKEIGLTEGAMSRFMAGTRGLKLETAERLAEFLGYRLVVTLMPKQAGRRIKQ